MWIYIRKTLLQALIQWIFCFLLQKLQGFLSSELRRLRCQILIPEIFFPDDPKSDMLRMLCPGKQNIIQKTAHAASFIIGYGGIFSLQIRIF